MIRYQLPPYEEIINFGCLLDVMSELPVKKASDGSKEVLVNLLRALSMMRHSKMQVSS